MNMKRKVLEEILADIDDKEGDKLKPKMEVAEIGVGKPDAMLDDSAKDGMPEPDSDDEMSDDDLKTLLKSYLG